MRPQTKSQDCGPAYYLEGCLPRGFVFAKVEFSGEALSTVGPPAVRSASRLAGPAELLI